MTPFATVLLALFGLACVGAGYRLFCGLPLLKRRGDAPRVAVFAMNMLPGALLAIFGAALFTSQTSLLLETRPGVHRHAPPTQETGWPRPAERGSLRPV